MENKNSKKQLPDVFKELKEARYRQVVQQTSQYAQKNVKSNKIKVKDSSKNAKKVKTQNKVKTHNKVKMKAEKSTENINYDIFQVYNQSYNQTETINHKFNAIGAVIGILIFILFMTTIKSNYIFATSKEEKQAIGTFEENENPMNLMDYMSANMSEVVKKEIITEKQIIEREVEYIENAQLPKDEQIVIQEGKDGYKEVTYIRSYENETLIEEIVISDILVEEAAKSTIQVGTSEFLADNQIHIGDTVYTIEEISLMNEPKEDSTRICTVYQYIDLTLKSVNNDWCKIVVDGIEGYVKSNKLTSAFVQPDIIEKNRIKRIMLNVNFDMNINKPSGLTQADFEKIFSNNVKDTNKIFEENAKVFYEIEQKYNINGLFVAAIGIHESNWGTSNIAQEKKNLFGYGAYDSSPYESSITFDSYEYGIEILAKALARFYINEPGTPIYDGQTALGTYYNGSTISGVNVRYASDQNWANRVYEIMLGLYEKLENE